MLRKRDDGFDILGRPEGIERLGGIDFDVAVFNHVWTASTAPSGPRHRRPAVLAAVARPGAECVDAKEALSADTDVSVPVVLPGAADRGRLTRNEFESMIRPPSARRSWPCTGPSRAPGDARPGQRRLLVGGSSRIPMVSQLLAGELGRPIAVDANQERLRRRRAPRPWRTRVGHAVPRPRRAGPSPPPARPRARGCAMPAPSGNGRLIARLPPPFAAAFLFRRRRRRRRQAGEAPPRPTPSRSSTRRPPPRRGPPARPTLDAVQSVYVNQCVENPSSRASCPTATERQGFCQCTFDAIRSTVPFDDFLELEAEADGTNETPPQSGLSQPCVEQFS